MNGERRAVLGLLRLAGLASFPARAEEAAHTCDVPAWLLVTESPLPKVREAVKTAQKLDILVVGTRSSTINTAEAMAWPVRLEAILREKLPAVQVNVNVELYPKKTSEEVAAALPKLAAERKPTLVIWQTGTVDALRSIDPDDFRVGVDEGVAALQKAGSIDLK